MPKMTGAVRHLNGDLEVAGVLYERNSGSFKFSHPWRATCCNQAVRDPYTKHRCSKKRRGELNNARRTSMMKRGKRLVLAIERERR